MGVAVVVPVYNRQATVPHTLDSVVGQTVVPSRLVIVDDGSTDGTSQAVQRWQHSASLPLEVRLLRQTNQGVGAARNAGLDEVGNCPLVAFLDSDDIWPQDFLQRTAAALSRRSDTVAVSTDVRVWDRNGQLEQAHDVRPVADDATWWFFSKGTSLTSCTVLRTDVVRQLGGFRTNLPSGQDIDLFLKVSQQGPWLHSAGAPVELRTAIDGDEGHLSQAYANRIVEWAQLRADFIAAPCCSARRTAGEYRRALARFWHEAGRDMLRQGCEAQARVCFWRAIQQRPTKYRAWWKLAESLLR